MEKFGVFVIRDLEGTSQGSGRQDTPSRACDLKFPQWRDLPLSMCPGGHPLHGSQWAGDHHPPFIVLQPTSCASLPVATLICDNLALSKTDNTSL